MVQKRDVAAEKAAVILPASRKAAKGWKGHLEEGSTNRVTGKQSWSIGPLVPELYPVTGLLGYMTKSIIFIFQISQFQLGFLLQPKHPNLCTILKQYPLAT